MARCLQEHDSFQVTLLPETLALETMCQALRQFLLEQTDGNDTLIYFTGHKILLESTTGYRETFLAASDTEIIRQAIKPMEPLYSSPFGKLNSLIQQSSLSSLVLLLDCCHSGDAGARSGGTGVDGVQCDSMQLLLYHRRRRFEESRAKRSDESQPIYGWLATSAVFTYSPRRRATSGLLFCRLSQSLKGSGQEALHLGWGNDIAIAT